MPKEPDFSEWGDRLTYPMIDFETYPKLEIFCNYIAASNYDRLDVLINNAAQGPSTFHWILPAFDGKRGLWLGLIYFRFAKITFDHSWPACKRFVCFSVSNLPKGTLKKYPCFLAWKTNSGIGLTSFRQAHHNSLQHDDSLSVGGNFSRWKTWRWSSTIRFQAKTNSWRLKLGEIHTNEMLEVQLVNSVAPVCPLHGLVNIMKKTWYRQKTHHQWYLNGGGNSPVSPKEARHPQPIWPMLHWIFWMTLTSAADITKIRDYYLHQCRRYGLRGLIEDPRSSKAKARFTWFSAFSTGYRRWSLLDVMDPLFDEFNSG